MKWRRWHSALGLAFGVFTLTHLAIASSARHPERFSAAAQALGQVKRAFPWLGGLLLLLTACLGGTGLYLLGKAGLAYTVKRCKRGGRFRYALQRYSAVVLLAFLAVHLFQCFRSYDATQAFATARRMVAGSGLTAPLYLLAVAGAAFHLPNGLSTAWVLWKLPEGGASLAARNTVLWLGGLLLLALGLVAWVALA